MNNEVWSTFTLHDITEPNYLKKKFHSTSVNKEQHTGNRTSEFFITSEAFRTTMFQMLCNSVLRNTFKVNEPS